MITTIRQSPFAGMCLLFAFSLPLSFAEAAGSLTIQSLSPGTTASINSPVTFTVVSSGLSSPVYAVADDVGNNLNSGLNAFGNFTWTPSSRDVGARTITITATDGNGNSATVSQAITVIVPSISLSAMTNGPAAYVGKPMTFQVTPVGFTNQTYWLGDSVGGSTLTNSRLNSSGAFYWVPVFSDIGTHKAMINVSDQSGHYAELTQDITVSPQPKPAVQSLAPGTTTPVGGTVTFSVTSPGFTSPTFSVHDAYSPSTITSDNMNSSGVFTWTPVKSQTGVHNIRVEIRDSSGQSSELLQTIFVQDAALAVGTLTPSDSVTVGSQVRFTVSAVGLSTPTYSVMDNFPGGSSVTTANISASGLFIWTPLSGDVGLHNIAVNATDAYGNFASVRADIKVIPAPVIPVNSSVAPNPLTPVTQQPAKYNFTKSLAIGSSGGEVTALQQLLLQLGFFTATPNGTFGPMTAAAVKKFQAANGLEQVGNVGPGTRAKLNAASKGASTGNAGSVAFRFTKALALGSSGTEVIELQKRLTTLGIYFGILSGNFDATTVAAVKKFQASRGLEQVGSVGPGTRAALNAF